MPTKMTPKLVTLLNNGARAVQDKLFTQQPYIHEDEFYQSVYTEQEIKTIRDAFQLIRCVLPNPSGTLGIEYDIEFEHDALPSGVTLKLKGMEATIRAHATTLNNALPNASRVTADNPVIRKALSDHLERMFMAGMVREITGDLVDKSPTLEAMRYVFPPTITLLRLKGEDGLANQISDVRRAPVNLPETTPMQRKFIRYLNQWFACQELLGTFTDEVPATPRWTISVKTSNNYFACFTDPETDLSHTVQFYCP